MEERNKQIQTETPPNTPTKIISVCSGKGGVGKTFISVNLGIALAREGKKILIFDGDLGLGNINLLFGFIPKHTIFHVLKGHRKLVDIVFHTSEGVDIIPGASGYSQIADLDSAQRENLLNGFSELENYDYIIIDVGAGISHNVISFALASDEVILVINPEPTSITDGYGLIKSLIVNESLKPISMIINKVRSESEGDRVVRRMQEISEKFLSFKPASLGFIPYDIEVENSIKKQKPILILAPTSKPAENIIAIAKKILGETDDIPKNGNSIIEFFKKRISFLEKKKTKKEPNSAS